VHLTLPPDFRARIAVVHGEAGARWLDRLPALVDEAAERWGLAVDPAPLAFSYNYVTRVARADGTRAVLKMGVPGPEIRREIAMVRHVAGEGMAALIESDADAGWMLLEMLEPGTPLQALFDAGEDERATSIAARVMAKLWKPPPPGDLFPAIADWGRGFERLRAAFGGGTGPFPARLVDEAERHFAGLASMDAPVLLHGDLHHGNVLSAGRAPWLAIDPKGIVGEPAFEVGALLRNPFPDLLKAPHPARLLARRLDLLADELGLDRERLRGWGMAQAVLSSWWSYEDGEEVGEYALACAALLSDTGR
jgi:streptomycin 6-kinase